MRITMSRWGHILRKRDAFHYTLSSFDDARKFSVGYRGTLIGDVAEAETYPGEWYATYDYGTAEHLRWVGGFRSRTEASLFLLGAKFERDNPAMAFTGLPALGNEPRVQHLGEVYSGTVIPR